MQGSYLTIGREFELSDASLIVTGNLLPQQKHVTWITGP
jgi:hypothetical protein